MEEQSDARLVEQTLLDNKEAFTVLVERYQLMSLCIVKRYVADEEVARELVQEALLQAYLSLPQLRDGSRFKNWFYGITLNICRSWLRRQKNSAVLYAMAQEVDQALSSNPEEVLLEQELRHIVSEAVAILTPGNREVAQLFYYEDLGLQEIARQKNLSLAAVKNRLYKSREQLRAYLQTQYPELATRVVRANRRRKTIMIPVTVAKVQDSDKSGLLFGTIVVLVDEQKERAIPFRYQNQSEYGPYKPLQKNAVAEPLTMDFIVNVIHGLGGTIEEMEIDTLQEEIIYARLRLHSRKGERSTINTRLDDALSLAVRLNTPISKEKPRNSLTLKQYIKITDYVGKRVRLSGCLRVSGVAEQANLYLSTGKSGIEGTQDWTPYEMTLFVPDEAFSLDFGLTLHGRGQVWLQAVTLATIEDQT